MKEFFKNFEAYIGSIFMSITTIIVTMNVFTRYCLKFTYYWAEEVAVACFVWTIFLGTAASYKENSLMGVEVVLDLLPERPRDIIELFRSVLLLIINMIMFYFSYTYIISSTKITAALGISYAYINAAIVVAFGLMTLYSLRFFIDNFKKVFLKKLQVN